MEETRLADTYTGQTTTGAGGGITVLAELFEERKLAGVLGFLDHGFAVQVLQAPRIDLVHLHEQDLCISCWDTSTSSGHKLMSTLAT